MTEPLDDIKVTEVRRVYIPKVKSKPNGYTYSFIKILDGTDSFMTLRNNQRFNKDIDFDSMTPRAKRLYLEALEAMKSESK